MKNRKRRCVLYLLSALLFMQTAFPVSIRAAGLIDEPVISDSYDSVSLDRSFSGEVSDAGNGKYTVSLSDTISGNSYTVMVLAGSHDDFPDSFLDDPAISVLYIDMKTAAGDTLEFTIKPKKTALSTVFVATGDGIPVRIGMINGEAYTDDGSVKCTISFSPGTGTGSMAQVVVDQGTLYTIPKCTFIAPGPTEVFDRWDGGSPGDVIRVFDDMSFTALWKVPESSSEEDPDEEETEAGDGSGLRVEFADTKAVYVYTGSPIRPEIKAFYDGRELVPDTDYSVAYINNVNASGKNKASVVVNGKGGFSGKTSLDFVIRPKSIRKGDTTGGTIPVDMPDTIYILKGTKKAQITATYGNYVLKPGGVDYYLTNPYGGYEYDTELGVNTFGRERNFTDSRSIKVKVVDRNELTGHQIKVSVNKENFNYDGRQKSPSGLKVYAPDGTDITDQKDTAYKILYLTDNTDAGNVKYTIEAMYPYSGEFKGSFKINPVSVTPVVDISDRAVYKASGAVPEKVKISFGGNELIPGKDYKISFSSNKKVGKGKYKISFLGNYSKTKKVTGSFDIDPANISDAKIVIPDVIYGKKPGTYSSAPFVEVDGTILKKSDMTVDYYDPEKNRISKDNPLELAERDSVKVSVSVTGKGNYTGTATGSYTVWKEQDNLINLDKSRIVTDNLKAVGKQNYTGYEIRPSFICQIKEGKDWTKLDSSKYRTYYIGNKNKGTAYIVIKPAEGSGLFGSKTVKFSVVIKKW